VVVDGDGGVEHSVAVRGDAAEPSARDFGDETVAPEFRDETGDALASSMGLLEAVRRSGIEARGDVVVAEPDDGVLAGEHRSEQREIGPADGVEAGGVTPAVGSWPAQGIEGGDAFTVVGGRGEGVEVAAVGAGPDFLGGSVRGSV
jgi:hypothetical protein